MKSCKFYLIADTHYFANSLGASGKAYDEFMRYEQKCCAETQSINEAVFEYLKNAKDADNVLIAGDLTFNGEKESHAGFIKLLNDLQNSGKNVYVVTADHDFKAEPFAFNENGMYKPEGIKRDDLFDLYYNFGFKNAISVDKKHLSYVAQISNGVRLLALNNDATEGMREFDDEQYEWIKQQARKAKKDGQIMFAMNHFPLIPGQPILSVIPKTYQKNSTKALQVLADEGIHIIFTGHMHNQSINSYVTNAGNTIYDVCTGSAIADPAIIRLVEINDTTANIKSIDIPDFEWDTGGKTCKQYLSDLYDIMITNLIYDMQYNPYKFMNKLGFGDKTKLFPIISKLGKIINTMTIGKLARLLCIKCDKSIKNLPVREYAIELVRRNFEGNQTFVKGTPKGDVFIAFLKRINPILKRINAKTFDGKKADLFDLLVNSAGNYDIDDYNAILPLN